MSIYVTIMYMFTYPVTFIYKSLVFCQFPMIEHVLDLVELELCTPAAPPMWSIRLQGRKRLVDQPTLERWHSFKS